MSKATHRFATQYRPNVDPGLSEFDESLTKQSMAEESDINTIMRRALRNGMIPPPTTQPRYVDLGDATTYHDAMNAVIAAQDAFYELPADVRAECANDPAVFLERLKDADWAVKHKLATVQEVTPSPASPDPKVVPEKPKPSDK